MKESITTRCMRTVEQALATHTMIPDGGAVLVGVSGGPDSMALLHVLQTVATKQSMRLGVAHLNHGLRPEASEVDEALVRKNASERGLPFYFEKADVNAVRKALGLSVEEAARKVRYRFLGNVARTHGFSAVALGHHADDNAELVLMNLLRGSGPLGLAGMPPRRSFLSAEAGEGEIHLIRPFLEIRRKDILAFVTENNIPSVTDNTNTDLRYRRNRIRCELLPLLRERYNPNIDDTLNRMARILRFEKEWADHLLAPYFEDTEPAEPPEIISLSRFEICTTHRAAGRRIVRMAIERAKGDLRQIGFRHIDAILELASRNGASGSLDLPDRLRVTVQNERLVFKKEGRPLRQIPPRTAGGDSIRFQHLLEKPGSLFIPELEITVRAAMLPSDIRPDFRSAGHRTAFFDMDAMSFPLIVRSPKPGDRFTPLGMTGRQKLKKYFIDHKIPANQRARCPVLESGGRPIWLMGYRMEDAVKITAGTKRVLKVEFSLA
jgi:tRNA(Ile)-lysidine synthase